MTAIPTTKKGIATRQKVLRAAARVFVRDGYVDARMLDIAQEAGLSTGGLYRYFDNKTDVFAAVIADLHEEFYERSGHTRALLSQDPYAALAASNRGYIEHYFDNRDIMRVFIEAAAIEGQFRETLRSMRVRHVRRFVSAYRSFDRDSPVEGVRLEVAAEALACLVEQCCYVWFAQEKDREEAVSVDEAVRITTQAWFDVFFASR